MAQTKRKRRTKHRGNAAGSIEARGRTSKPQEGQARKAPASRGARAAARDAKPPSWPAAAAKATFGAVILFAFARFGLLGDESSTGSALTLAAVAMLFYTPVMYLTDKWVYSRKLRQAAGGAKR